jgi:hypothetical protein
MQYLPDPKIIYNRLKQSARKRDIDFQLTVSDIIHLSLPLTCPIFGIPLVYNRGKAMDNSFSVDRIDPNRGYIADNIWVISWKANRMKSNATLEELKLLGNLTI